MMFLVIEFEDRQMRRVCVSTDSAEVEQFLAGAAPQHARPPKHGWGSVMWNQPGNVLPPSTKAVLRAAAIGGIPVIGNLNPVKQ